MKTSVIYKCHGDRNNIHRAHLPSELKRLGSGFATKADFAELEKKIMDSIQSFVNSLLLGIQTATATFAANIKALNDKIAAEAAAAQAPSVESLAQQPLSSIIN